MNDFIFKRFGVSIWHGVSRADCSKAAYFKDGLTFQQRSKYQWYFEYRAALLRVKNPKWHTRIEYFDYVPDQRTKDEIEAKYKRDKTIAAKARITKIENRIKMLKEDTESQLFGYESHHAYPILLNELEKANQILKDLTNVNK